MFPLRDENPSVLTPVVTILLIGLNVAAWLFIQGMGSEPSLSASVCERGLIPAELFQRVPDGYAVQMGRGLACVITRPPNWSAILTSMFMHGSWFHLIGNMWFMWVFGNNVEDSMGHLRFLVFYLLCGVVAAAAQIAVNPASTVPMVGASGAISGVMGAYVLLYPKVRVQTLVFLGIWVSVFALPAYVLLGYWFLLQLLSGAMAPSQGGGVAVWAHAGGFVAGALLVFLFRNPALVARHQLHHLRFT